MGLYVVAVTGGVASGKSAVTERFEALGVTVHDADLIARELVLPGQPALAEIVERFGSGVLAADGSLDRRALRARVFSVPGDRAALEAILHPRVRALLRHRAHGAGTGEAHPATGTAVRRAPPAGSADARAPDAGAGDAGADVGAAPYVVLAIPLLAESQGDYSWLDRVLVVDVPREVQHARLLARDSVDSAAADAMLAAQASRAQRLAIADDVIVNDGPIAALDAAVRTLDARYRALASVLDDA